MSPFNLLVSAVSLITPCFWRPVELSLPFILLPPFLLRPHNSPPAPPSPLLSGWHQAGKDFNKIKLDSCQLGRPGVSGELSPSLCSVSLVHFTSPHLNIVISVLPLPSPSLLLGFFLFPRARSQNLTFAQAHYHDQVKIGVIVQYEVPCRKRVMPGPVQK